MLAEQVRPEPARFATAHGQAPPIPGVEVADHTDAARIGCPQCKRDTLGTLVDDLVRAEFLIARKMVALGEEVNVEFAENWRETIDVVELGLDGAMPYAQPIAEWLLPIGAGRSKETVAMNPHTFGRDFAGSKINDRHFLRLRQHCSYADPGWGLMHSEERERIVMTPLDNSLDLRVGLAWHARPSDQRVRRVRHARSFPFWPKSRESL